MSGGSKKQTVGYRFKMGLHMVACLAPVDAFLALIAGGRKAWSGEQTTSGSISISAPELFGGESREGGIDGQLDVMMGDDAQGTNAYLSSVQSGPQPSYRGVLSFVFRRGLVSANNPYIKPWAFRVRRIIKGWFEDDAWYPEKAAIHISGTESSGLIEQFTEKAFGLDLVLYATVSGNRSIFSAGTSAYGGAILIASQNSGTASSIRRSISLPRPAVALSVYFIVTAANSDDAPYIQVEAGGVEVFSFLPMRETTFDSLRRARLFVSGGSAEVMGPAVSVGTWYRLQVIWNAAEGTWTATISVAATGSVHSSASGVSPAFMTGADSLRFYVDPNGPTCPAQFSNLEITCSGQFKSMNPAHIVYECLTNPDWGMGYSSSIIDGASFAAAADVFFGEGMGLCFFWTQQEPIESFIQRVVDHAGAVLRQDPKTGLFILKPIRADYDIEDLPVFDPSNIIEMESFQRPGPPESVNEVTVKFNSVETGEQGSVTVQNIAAVASQGGVVSQPVNYPGLPTEALSLRVAMRDLRVKSTPLASARFTANRYAHAVLPGDVLVLNWPKLQVLGLVLRVVRVNTGAPRSGRIMVEAVEDVFSLAASTYVAATQPGWVDPSTAPTPTVTRIVSEAPYFELQQRLSSSEIAALTGEEAYLYVAAGRPTAGTSYELATRIGGSSDDFQSAGQGDYCPTASLNADLAPGATSATVENMVDVSAVRIGSYAIVDDEIIRIDSLDTSTGAMTFGRGVLDTVAAAHLDGSVIFFCDDFNTSDNVERIDGEDLDVKILTRTGLGTLDQSMALTDAVSFDRRIAWPYPPGQFKINGIAYPTSPIVSGTLTLTWAHRSRVQQNLEGDESGNIGPEPGTTYSLQILGLPGLAVLASQTGITGTTFSTTSVHADGDIRAELWSVRDGYPSGQRHRWDFPYSNPLSSAASGATLAPVASLVLPVSDITHSEALIQASSASLPKIFRITFGGSAARGDLVIVTAGSDSFAYRARSTDAVMNVAAAICDLVDANASYSAWSDGLQVYVTGAVNTDFALSVSITGSQAHGDDGGSQAGTGKLLTAAASIVPGTALAGDPNYANVVLLLHCDGTNGSTTFTDNSGTPKTVTAVSGAQISTASPKFGTGAALFNGTGALLSVPHSAAFDFGSGNWTISMQVMHDGIEVIQNIIAKRSGVNYGPFSIIMTAAGRINVRCSTSGSSWTVDFTGAVSLTPGVYSNVEIVRSGTTVYLFVDGVADGTGAISGSVVSNSEPVYIGANSVGGSPYFGRFDEIRIDKGVARHTAGFTPPASSFPNN